MLSDSPRVNPHSTLHLALLLYNTLYILPSYVSYYSVSFKGLGLHVIVTFTHASTQHYARSKVLINDASCVA